MQNPLIVPVKVLRSHQVVSSLGKTLYLVLVHTLIASVPHSSTGVLDIVFHPHQPWLISAGADSTLRLYT